MRQVRRFFGSRLLALFGPAALRPLIRSWKLETRGDEHWDAAYARPGMLVTLWHGRMLLGIPAGADSGLSVLVSPSGDGRLVTTILPHFGYGWILGSSNKNPAKALREMLDRLTGGGRIVITPDGPRGPRHAINNGTAWLARETGFPILAVGCASDRAWQLKSWDRFTIPKWGARVVVQYAEPLEIARGADDAELERASQEVRRRMLVAEEAAFRHLGRVPDWEPTS